MTVGVRPGEFEGSILRARHRGAFDIRAVAVADRGQRIGRHTHDEAHFMLVLSGAYIASAGGAPAPVRPPYLAYEPAGTTHADRFAECAGAFVAITVPEEITPDLPEGPQAVSHPRALGAALGVARELRGAGADAAVLEAGAWELVASLDDATREGPLPGWARRAYEALMDEAADAGLTIGQVAARAGVHPTHLARVFRQAFGCTPGELLRWRRVERTADLLARSALPAAEIAAAAGFTDQSHMSRAFKAFYGLTPGGWRRAHDVAPIQDAAGRAA